MGGTAPPQTMAQDVPPETKEIIQPDGPGGVRGESGVSPTMALDWTKEIKDTYKYGSSVTGYKKEYMFKWMPLPDNEGEGGTLTIDTRPSQFYTTSTSNVASLLGFGETAKFAALINAIVGPRASLLFKAEVSNQFNYGFQAFAYLMKIIIIFKKDEVFSLILEFNRSQSESIDGLFIKYPVQVRILKGETKLYPFYNEKPLENLKNIFGLANSRGELKAVPDDERANWAEEQWESQAALALLTAWKKYKDDLSWDPPRLTKLEQIERRKKLIQDWPITKDKYLISQSKFFRERQSRLQQQHRERQSRLQQQQQPQPQAEPQPQRQRQYDYPQRPQAEQRPWYTASG
jgi:hypothetical protein